MKIVVFGASGKTGTLLVDQALKAGHDVVAYVRRPGSVISVDPKLKVIVGSLSDKEALKKAIAGSDACFSTLGWWLIDQKQSRSAGGNLNDRGYHGAIECFKVDLSVQHRRGRKSVLHATAHSIPDGQCHAAHTFG